MENSATQQESERLLQTRRISVIEEPRGEAFVCVYSSEDTRNGFHTFCFFLPPKHGERFLKEVGWDLRPDDFTPHVEQEEGYEAGKPVRNIYYLPEGNEWKAQALARIRDFWGIRPSAIEIAEEFRLFHNLYHDTARNVFLHCDVHGEEHEVVRYSTRWVEVHLKFLMDFLRATQMHLAMQWEGNYWSKHSLEELGLKEEEKEQRGRTFFWNFVAWNSRHDAECKSISRLLGKALLRCPGPVEYRNAYTESGATYPSFIVGHDEEGAPVKDTCDPGQVKGDAQRGMSLAFFRRGVLAKYFAEPRRYLVEDGRLSCGGLWGLRMDNDHPKYVIAFLMDLGLGLPPMESAHWESHNVAPDGGPSETFYTRNIRGWFASPKMPDLRLKSLYPRVNELWKRKYGWLLWREAAEEDFYIFRQVHVCLEENQAEFDQQNGLLAKLLNDFLNEAKITAAIKAQPTPIGGLNRLQQFLLDSGHADAEAHIKSLRLVQDLRSKGSAHRKSEEYTSCLERAGLAGLSIVECCSRVFSGAVGFVEWIRTAVLNDKSA